MKVHRCHNFRTRTVRSGPDRSPGPKQRTAPGVQHLCWPRGPQRAPCPRSRSSVRSRALACHARGRRFESVRGRHAVVAQLVRAPPCQGGGRGFESRLPLQFLLARWLSGSSGRLQSVRRRFDSGPGLQELLALDMPAATTHAARHGSASALHPRPLRGRRRP